MTHQEIIDFVERVKPELDAPGVYVPMLNQYLTKQEQWSVPGLDMTRVCYVMPVPESMAIQNIGMGILLRIINEDMRPEFIGSIHYFPENKMLKRMRKFGVPLFDNWLFHPLSDFDILGFSSYFSLQYLNFIPMLRLAGVPYLFNDRVDDWDLPVVILGGVQAYSAEPVAPLFDAYLIGEGEEMNTRFFELYHKRKSDGTSKREFLYEAAREIQGVYLPWAYEFTYYPSDDSKHPNQIMEYHLTDEAKSYGVPLKVLKAAIEFRDSEPFTKSLVSNIAGGDMSIGSIFCANSCSNLCSFCQGSALTLPYREIPFEPVKQAAVDIMKNTGTGVVNPYSFNVSDLSYANRFVADMLSEQNVKVSLSSERLDTLDDAFVQAAIKSGRSTFTVAIEAASPRGRHILNKNLTEEQILRAFECLFRNGASRIKIYNISSWPFETEEDREYYVTLMKKIMELKARYGSNAYIRLSFTPFAAKPHTILQWSKQNDIVLDENGVPYIERTYDNVLQELHKIMTGTYTIGFSTGALITILSYTLNYGDRRLFPVVQAMADDPDVKYIGGMGVGSSGVEAYIRYIKELTPFDLGYFYRERPIDEVFPWEAISCGIDKEWLGMFYEKVKRAAKTPVDEEGTLRRPCYEACTYCGICRSLDKSRGNNGESRNPDGSINELYWESSIYGNGRELPVFVKVDNSLDHINVVEKVSSYVRPHKNNVMRFEVDINPYYRFVDARQMKYRFRRACFRVGIPINADLQAASDKILVKAYFSGKEIYEVFLLDSSFKMSEQMVIDRMNEELDDALRVVRCSYYSKQVKPLKRNFDYVLYSLTLPSSEFSFEKCVKQIKIFEESEFYPVKVKQKKLNGSAMSFVNVIVNAKELSYVCFNKDNGDGTWTLFAALSDNLAIYDFASVVLKVTRRNLYRYPAVIEEFLLKSTTGSAFDMFADTCSVCGEEIETNIWGDPVDSFKCLKHKYLSDFVHRDVDVSVNSADYLEELGDDETKFIDMDVLSGDMDLEDYVLKGSGSTSV